MQHHNTFLSLACGVVAGSVTVAASSLAAEPAPPPDPQPAPAPAPAPSPAPAPAATGPVQPATAQPAGQPLGVPADSLSEPEPSRAAPPGTKDERDEFFTSIDITGHLGVGVRLDDPPVLQPDTRAGLLYGLGADLFFTEHVSLGVHYEHLDLGEEGGEMFRNGTIRLTRDLNSMWVRLRAYPWRGDDLAFYVAIAAAPVWQSADAKGSLWYPEQPGVIDSFNCEGADSVNLAMRGAVGLDGSPAPPMRLWTSLGFDTYRLSDQSLDNCAPGAGTAAVFALRAGIAFGIPLREE